MLNYKLYQDNRKNNPNKGMWYARASVNETLDLDGLAKHMADHHSPYSQGLITGILKDMVNCIRELALDGKAVKIPDLAIFSLGIKTKPADSPENFTPQKNVRTSPFSCNWHLHSSTIRPRRQNEGEGHLFGKRRWRRRRRLEKPLPIPLPRRGEIETEVGD